MQILRFANEVVADNVACYESRPGPCPATMNSLGPTFHSHAAHNMWNLPFVCRNCANEGQSARWNIFGVFAESGVVEVSQNETSEREWPKGRADRYAAILILTKR